MSTFIIETFSNMHQSSKFYSVCAEDEQKAIDCAVNKANEDDRFDTYYFYAVCISYPFPSQAGAVEIINITHGD